MPEWSIVGLVVLGVGLLGGAWQWRRLVVRVRHVTPLEAKRQLTRKR